MSFDWTQYYELAKELTGRSGATASQEAKKRSAISRAYYSALLPARDKASSRSGDPIPGGGTHSWTIGRLKSDPDPNAKKIGVDLERLKKRREKADYEDVISNLNSELTSALAEAGSLLQRIHQLPTSK